MRGFPKIAQFISWHRRVVAASLAILALMALIAWLTAPPPQYVAALVLTGDVAAGQAIAASDVSVAQAPPETVPHGALQDPHDAIGHRASTPMLAGTVMQPGFLLEEHRLAEGRALVPITLADAHLRALLHPGTVVTLVVGHMEGIDVVTNDAIVSAVPTDDAPGGLLPAPGTGGGLVLVDVPDDAAGTVATLGQQGNLSVILGG